MRANEFQQRQNDGKTLLLYLSVIRLNMLSFYALPSGRCPVGDSVGVVSEGVGIREFKFRSYPQELRDTTVQRRNVTPRLFGFRLCM